MFVDSHTHLGDKKFDKDREEIIERSGLDYILNIAVDTDRYNVALETVERYEFIYLSAGIHPHDAENADFDRLKDILSHQKTRAVGEIGLDFYRNYSDRDAQEKVFRECMQQAEERHLPVVIHQRDASQEVFKVIEDYSVIGVMHCFSGSKGFAERCIELGYYISFAGNITFKNAENLRRVARVLPLERLLIETDCPWLAPQPHRGKRNEPAFVKYVAETIAELKSESTDKVAKIVKDNFKRLFNIE